VVACIQRAFGAAFGPGFGFGDADLLVRSEGRRAGGWSSLLKFRPVLRGTLLLLLRLLEGEWKGKGEGRNLQRGVGEIELGGRKKLVECGIGKIELGGKREVG